MRPAYFPELGGFVETPVFRRAELLPGARIEGPAVVEEDESTVVVVPDAPAVVLASGLLRIDLAQARGFSQPTPTLATTEANR